MSLESTLLMPLLKPLEGMQVHEGNQTRVRALIALVVNVARSGLIYFQQGKLGVFEGLRCDPLSPARTYKIVQMSWEGRPGIDYRIEQLKQIQFQDMSIHEGPLGEGVHNLGLDEAPISREERLLILSYLIHISRCRPDPSRWDSSRLRNHARLKWNLHLYPQDLWTLVRRASFLLREETIHWMREMGRRYFFPGRGNLSPYISMRIALGQIFVDGSEFVIKFFDPVGGGQKFKTRFVVENGKLVAQNESPEILVDPTLVFECDSNISPWEIQHLDVARALLASSNIGPFRPFHIRRTYARIGTLE